MKLNTHIRRVTIGRFCKGVGISNYGFVVIKIKKCQRACCK
jgi:hypothetical protein